jgi:hypothetical protein
MVERCLSWRRGLGCTRQRALVVLLLALLGVAPRAALAQPGPQSGSKTTAPRPILEICFPAGVQRGQLADLKLFGVGLEGASRIVASFGASSAARGQSTADGTSLHLDGQIASPAEVAPGFYEVWVEGPGGVSGPRTLLVSDVPEVVEVEAESSQGNSTQGNSSLASATRVSLNQAINGRMDAAGDQDHFCFHAEQGQLVVLECLAERIDSRMRAILELYDARGKRLAVNRGFFGTEPLIAFRVPETADYIVRVQDLVLAGGPDHVYRLEIDTRPRVAFCHPAVVRAGEASQVTLFGWNLGEASGAAAESSTTASPGDEKDGLHAQALERRSVTVEAETTRAEATDGLRLEARQLEWRGVAWHYPGSVRVVPLATTDVPVVTVNADDTRLSSSEPPEVSVPSEVAGQLLGTEAHWFALSAQRGEVLHVEAWGQRLPSPVDLQVCVCRDDERRTILHTFPPREPPVPTRDAAPVDFALQTTDPAGRWVAPEEGRYLLLVRDLAQGTDRDPRRVYRLAVRREEAESAAVVVARRDESSAIVLAAGGREVLDVWAVRRRGSQEGLRLRTLDVPAGVECPETWIAPHATHGTLVLSSLSDAVDEAEPMSGAGSGTLRLEMESADGREVSIVRVGSRVRAGRPEGWGRIASRFHVAVRGHEPYRLTLAHDPAPDHHLYGALRFAASQGSVLDLFVRLERDANVSPVAVRLVGEGLPDLVRNESALLPAGSPGTFLSFYLPPTLPVGNYTWVVRGDIEQRLPDGKVETRTLFSNPVTVEVVPAKFHVTTDPLAVTRARRGETILVRYQAQRLPGFIGKMHTELAVAGKVTDVPGLLSRGETFVGLSEQGSLQIIVQDDAPLGRVPALRLLTVGVVEDEPRYFGSSPVNLEIVE